MAGKDGRRVNNKQLYVGLIFGLAAVIVLVYATQYDSEQPQHVPDIQTEAQFNAFGIDTGFNVAAGTPLDMDPSLHFWAPGFGAAIGDRFGFDFDNQKYDIQPVPTPHRYPAVSGGNITSVMHHGWSSLNEPKCNEWFRNPPSVAVL
jgi:hypothetical protein